jgi:hypothetical protein
MWEYRGQNDCTRSTTVEWSKDEYRKVLAKITTTTFTSLDTGLQPFSGEKPAPTVCGDFIYSCIEQTQSTELLMLPFW